MEEIEQIAASLQRGDKQRIAELTKSSLDTVVKVLNLERSSTSPKGQLILFAAKELLEQRERLAAYTQLVRFN